jgi:hypothetical protein
MARRRAGVFVAGERTIGKKNADENADENADDKMQTTMRSRALK